MKILFFIESLRSGGKERRLLELIQYLKFTNGYEVALVLTENTIDFEYVYDWDIPITIIERKGLKKDPRIFFKFLKICKKFKPDIIHTWGVMNTFYAIPTKLFLNTPLITSMISNANFSIKTGSLEMLFFKASCYFSDSILANSLAGLEAYKIKSKKAKVIYNGVNIKRFEKQFDKNKIKNTLKISTPYMIVMVASINSNKNYDLFVDVAKEISKVRNDITFIGVGGGSEFGRISERIKNENIRNVSLIGFSKDVESIVSASDIGVLFTYCEGFPNSVMEYMALGKPVIVSDVGGTNELVEDSKIGYLISNNNTCNICTKINYLIDNPDIKIEFGQQGFELIRTQYSIEKMSLKFNEVYSSLAFQKS